MYKDSKEIEELQRLYDEGKLPPSRKEGIVVNPKVAIEITDEDIVKSIPLEYLEKNQHKYGKINRFSKITPVANLIWDYFYFRDISVFRPAAIAYEQSLQRRSGTRLRAAYTHHPAGSTAWKKFWQEEGRRIIKGYEPIVDGKPCGIRIPGELYFYLNYGRVKKVELDDKGKVVKDEVGFPDFLAMDFYYMKELEARENPDIYGLPPEFKKSLTVVKSRRMGFSYKASVGSVWQTAFDRNNLVIIASGTGDDGATCFLKSMELIDFLSEYTPFGVEEIGEAKHNGGWIHAKRTVKKSEGKFDFRITSTRTPDSAGRKSTIKTVSLHHEADAISGEGLGRLYFEESGKNENLEPAWTFAEPAMKVGQLYRKGIAVVFGTGGEMVSNSGKAGSSVGLSNMFYKPSSYSMASYKNIYDYGETDAECGLFFGVMWFYNAPPIEINGKMYKNIDSCGNPFFWVTEVIVNVERETKKANGSKNSDYDRFLTQYCKTPSEAFLITKGSRFQVEDLVARKIAIETSKNGYDTFRMPGELVEIDDKVDFIPKPNLQPITMATLRNYEREGCLLRYVAPKQRLNKKEKRWETPDDAYIISVDPIGINTSGGDSLIAIIVYNTGKYPEMGEEGIVATYYGRPRISPMEYMNRLLLKLSKYYNARISFENDRGGDAIMTYFLQNKALNRLLPMPKFVMSANIKSSRTMLRAYGHSMASEKHKDIGEKYIYEWLDKRNHESILYDTETGEQVKTPSVRNLDRLRDEILLNQLIQYDRSGNYDAVSAFMGIMIQMQELYELDKGSDEEAQARSEGISDVYNKIFKQKDYK